MRDFVDVLGRNWAQLAAGILIVHGCVWLPFWLVSIPAPGMAEQIRPNRTFAVRDFMRLPHRTPRAAVRKRPRTFLTPRDGGGGEE